MISIITAAYNHAQFLAGALASVEAQAATDWEHIVVDDGSTDDTAALLAAHARPRLRVFSTANHGQAAALNFGIREARGELVAFLDADDEYLPSHLSTLSASLGSADFVLGKFSLETMPGAPAPLVRDFYNPGRTISVQDIEVITGALFARREALLRVGGFRPVPSTDTDLVQRFRAGGFREGPKPHSATYRYFFGRAPNSQAVRDRDSP